MIAYSYSYNLQLKDALQLYFSKYHFENGGYHLKWFRIKVGPVFIPLPNTKDRIAAVKIHDIHHILTEYPATLKGEAEIGAWEIASGCGPYYVAWLLNCGSLFYGLYCFPKALFNAFMRGRQCRTNCYHHTSYNDALLNRTVGDLRDHCGMMSPGKINAADILSFLGWNLLVQLPFLLFIYCLLL